MVDHPRLQSLRGDVPDDDSVSFPTRSPTLGHVLCDRDRFGDSYDIGVSVSIPRRWHGGESLGLRSVESLLRFPMRDLPHGAHARERLRAPFTAMGLLLATVA